MVFAGTRQEGFSLIEFLVALVILSVGLLGLLQAVNVSLNQNMGNHLRNEATVVADEALAMELAKGSTQVGFDAISTSTSSLLVNRKLQSGFVNYSVVKTGSAVTANTKEVSVQVSWRYKSSRSLHRATSLITKAQQ